MGDTARLTYIDKPNAYDQVVAVEMLESQALRTLVLGLTFATAAMIIAVVGSNFYIRYGWNAAITPAAVFASVCGVACYEFVMRRAIRRHIRLAKPVPTWVWYANACVEVTALTAIMMFIHGAMSNPIYVLSTPPLVGYFLFIILSTLYLDTRLCLFTGGLAATQYFAIVLYIFLTVGSDAPADAIFLTPGMYLAKTSILLMGGFGAAFVARELSRRQLASFNALEERNREQHANTMKSQFLSDMSHEIRTPLNAVIGYAQLLETDSGITPAQRRAVEAIRIGGRHLLAVVNDVLDISKIEAGSETVTPSRFNLTGLLQELTLIFAARCAEKRLSWIFDMSAQVGDVAADEAKLRQVLTNILGNAVKFTENGHVALRVSGGVSGGDGDIFHFEIEDTGPGISEDQHDDIFDPFAQDMQGRLSGGTGLGLAIAQRYIGLMGGEISVQSTPGNGACFRFSISLPAATAENLATARGPSPQPVRLAPGQSVRALVADDIETNRDILKRLLEQAGVKVHTAETGAGAIDIIRNTPIDIAYLDIRMPDMSGTDVARRLTDMNIPNLKIVAVSASVLVHEQTEYMAAGFDDFLDKPVQMQNLYASLTRLLGVTFEDVAATGDDGGGAVVAPRPVLPTALRQALSDAATRQNITDLKRHISEMETIGETERIFAARLRELCGTYDMNAVLTALNETDHD